MNSPIDVDEISTEFPEILRIDMGSRKNRNAGKRNREVRLAVPLQLVYS
jgi:hypothetical protein